jgi:hypothetical protein
MSPAPPKTDRQKETAMKTSRIIVSLCLTVIAAAASAQNAATDVQRDVNQQTRIRNGLQDGSLTTREAAVLEHQESQVDRLEARDMKNGPMTAKERAQIARAQNRVSNDIYQARHNGVDGNPLSASSQRMQQAVQRDINQEQRIDNGIKSGQLSNNEVSRLERGQAHVDSREFHAGRDGYVGSREGQAINGAQNRQSARIYRLKHNGVTRG